MDVCIQTLPAVIRQLHLDISPTEELKQDYAFLISSIFVIFHVDVTGEYFSLLQCHDSHVSYNLHPITFCLPVKTI